MTDRAELRLYDTMTGAVRDFVPLRPGHVSIYLCGATVQGLPHIGHVRSGVAFDILRRWLMAKGYDVAFFGWSGPDFLAKDADLAKSLNQLHERLAWLLTGLVAVHVAAAFWHHFGLHDDTLRRMMPPRA